MFQRRNRFLKRIKQFDANPTKTLTQRQQRLSMRKLGVFSALTKKSYARRVMLRATSTGSHLENSAVWRRGNPIVYPLQTVKYLRPKWYWTNPSAVPGLVKVQKVKFLSLHQRYALAILNQWMYHRSRKTWIRWLQQVRWNTWAWVQRLEHLPNNLLTKVGWFNHPKEALQWLKRSGVQLNSFPKGELQFKSYTTTPGDFWNFTSVAHYHHHLSRQSHSWVEQWSTPFKRSFQIYF
jgi:hypothetical protein